MADGWHGVSIQKALLSAEIVEEDKFTEAGVGTWYYLKLRDKIIPLGRDKHFAEMLVFALVRNAEAFERTTKCP